MSKTTRELITSTKKIILHLDNIIAIIQETKAMINGRADNNLDMQNNKQPSQAATYELT